MASPYIKGTTLSVRFSRVIDGDTIRVYLPNSTESESIRILDIDTEESFSFQSSKPRTPWGLKAKSYAYSFFKGAETVLLEFPGNEPADVAVEKYRGIYGRLLAYVHKDGLDYQYVMIRKGYTPYFNKYGNSVFASHHARYVAAERQAQIEDIGVWDQIAVNGFVARDYISLKAWWDLRASCIDQYRRVRVIDNTVYNTRLDYQKLLKLAERGAAATVFTAVADVRRSSGSVGLVDIGSKDRPFALKIPDMDCEDGKRVIALLKVRYIGTQSRPTAGYCYATGRLEMGRDGPQMEILNPDAITDSLATRAEVTGPLPPLPPPLENEKGDDAQMTPVPDDAVAQSGPTVVVEGVDLIIAACYPNPAGTDKGNETVTLLNKGQRDINLDGWVLRDRVRRTEQLSGTVGTGKEVEVTLSGRSLTLNNQGDDIMLFNEDGVLVSSVSYGESDVADGQAVRFL